MTIRHRRTLRSILLAAVSSSAAASGFAQEAIATQQPGAVPPAPPQAAGHVQVDGEKILDLLVAKGVISKADADGIVAQATVVTAPPPSQIAAGGVDGDVQTIPYIPETVRKQIKDELRTEVKQEAKAEGWAAPGLIPDWLGRVTLEGDVRVRDEEDAYDKNNDPDLVNFQAINSGSPYNINRAIANSPNPPFLNSTRDRNRTRIRARLGLIAQPDDWIKFEIRLATGNDNSPVSPNQTLGASGDSSKYAAWFDRFDVMLTPHGFLEGLRVDLGRGENPFWSTPLQFYPDLNMDGFSARYRRQVLSNLEGFGTIGAFPIFNTAMNFGSTFGQPTGGEFSSRDEWMFAGQLGAAWKATKDVKLTAAVGYFDFNRVQGKLSAPCLASQDVCNTDTTRTPFEQWGNSLTPVRNIIPDPAAAPGLSPDPQYFGLASAFRILDVHGALDFTGWAGVPVRIEGDYLDNLAFSWSSVASKQVNVGSGTYNPGGRGWLVNLAVGKPQIERLGDWNFSAGYRWLASDATVDAIADADFHLGGTNAKGYVLTGYYGIARNTSLGARWFSADVITGPAYSNDVLQIDLNTKF